MSITINADKKAKIDEGRDRGGTAQDQKKAILREVEEASKTGDYEAAFKSLLALL